MCVILFNFSISNAQKLKLEKLEQILNASLNDAEESLFLTGYSFLSEKEIPDSAGIIYTFSNRKKTIGTAKIVWKGVYYQEKAKSFVKYITYDRREFEHLRKLMITNQFVREDPENLAESSTYSKGNLRINFEVTTDEYENITFVLTLNNIKAIEKAKEPKKITLRGLFKQQEE